jgi:hypothetical protein
VAGIVQRQQALRKTYGALERGQNSDLFDLARGLVRYAAEVGKPNGDRLKEYTDSRLPQYKQGVLSKRPIYKEMETATLGWSLTKLREDLARIFRQWWVGSLVAEPVVIGISPPMSTEDCRCQSVPMRPSNSDGLAGVLCRPHSMAATSSATAACCCSNRSMNGWV